MGAIPEHSLAEDAHGARNGGFVTAMHVMGSNDPTHKRWVGHGASGAAAQQRLAGGSLAG